jgi:hypothetical protein
MLYYLAALRDRPDLQQKLIGFRRFPVVFLHNLSQLLNSSG